MRGMAPGMTDGMTQAPNPPPVWDGLNSDGLTVKVDSQQPTGLRPGGWFQRIVRQSIVGATYTLFPGELYICDVGLTQTLTLPTEPPDGTVCGVICNQTTFLSHAVVGVGGNDLLLDTSIANWTTTSFQMQPGGSTVTLAYDRASATWYPLVAQSHPDGLVANGDMPYYLSALNYVLNLNIGNTWQVLTVSGGLPAYKYTPVSGPILATTAGNFF